MAIFETWLRNDLKKPILVRELSGNLFSADNEGNLIGVEVYDNGQAATLSGTVTGYVIRPDSSTVVVTGTLSGNRASIVLPASAYVIVGQTSIVIKVGTVTVGACVAYVYRTTTDTIVDPGQVVPSIAELLEKIVACEAATTAANNAASSANSAATNANTKASLADEKATAANTAAGTANAAATKINDMTVAASGLSAGSSPTVQISEVSGHKHIVFGIPKGDTGDVNIDDTAGDGDTNKAWSADKLVSEFGDKADKVSSATNGDFAGLDSNGNLTDSGKKASDFALASEVGTVPTGKTVQGEIADLYTVKADIIEISDSTAESVKTITDGADNLPMAVTIGIDPVQDLHGYDNPWPAGGNINIVDDTYEKGKFNLTTGAEEADTSGNNWRSKYFGIVDSSKTYYAKMPDGFTTSVANITIFCYQSDGTFIERITNKGNTTFTVDASCAKIRVLIYFATAQNTYTNSVCINISDPAKNGTHVPYSNICPISGWTGANVSRTGVNVWDEEWEVGGINWTTGENTSETDRIRSKEYIAVKPNTSYCFTPEYVKYIWMFDENGSIIQNVSGSNNFIQFSTLQKNFTTPDNCYYIRFLMWTTYGTTYNNDISINYPSTDTQYHAYSGNTFDITFPNPPGTVYGGTLTVNEDGTGTLVVDHADVDLGTLTWERNNNKYFRASLPLSKVTGTTQGQPNAICSIYRKAENGYVVYNATQDKVFIVNSSYISSEPYVSIADSDYTDADTFESAMSGVHLVYELATPVTYNLTAEQVGQILSLKGTNNVWADTGNISVNYSADTKLYIDGKFASLQALILENISNT